MGADPMVTEPEHQEDPQLESPDPDRFVSREDYNKLLSETQSVKEKAELFDSLIEDPEFHAYLDRDEKSRAIKQPQKQEQAPPKQEDDIVAKLEAVIAPIKQEINSMKSVYEEDQTEALRQEADRQIDAMTKDADNFPFFKDVQVDMAKLLETGRATNMVDAYRLAAFGKAKAEGRSEVIKKGKEQKKIMPSGAKVEKREGAKDVFQGGKKSLRDILSESFDEAGVELVEGEGD